MCLTLLDIQNKNNICMYMFCFWFFLSKKIGKKGSNEIISMKILKWCMNDNKRYFNKKLKT